MLFETVIVAFSMFSALPVPRIAWNRRNMRWALCAFPLVGAVIGCLWWGWEALCVRLALPELLQAAGLCLLPAAATGGIHLDGYADTCDALASHSSPERRQEILKDSHCGAFAVIRLCMYFTGYLALCSAVRLDARGLAGAGLSFVLSRTLSGFAIAVFPLAKKSGLAYTFAASADKTAVGWILGIAALLLCGAMWLLGGAGGGTMTLAAVIVLWGYVRTARRDFGGISGDLAGWFLQRAEFWMLAALVLWQYGEAFL